MAWYGKCYYDKGKILLGVQESFERLLRFGLGMVDSDLGYEHGYCELLVFAAWPGIMSHLGFHFCVFSERYCIDLRRILCLKR